jgi:hypothetical protein
LEQLAGTQEHGLGVDKPEPLVQPAFDILNLATRGEWRFGEQFLESIDFGRRLAHEFHLVVFGHGR